jgi:hypothetical protein
MVRNGTSGPSDRSVERAKATFDQGVRAVKTWWRSREEQRRPLPAVDPITEPPEPPAEDRVDALVAQVSQELEQVRHDVDGHDVELLHALERLATSYERVVQRLDEDRRERRMLAEAVLRLERRLSEPGRSNAEPTNGERITGGWVTPIPEGDLLPHAVAPDRAIEPEAALDRRDDDHRDDDRSEVDRISELFGDPVPERR